MKPSVERRMRRAMSQTLHLLSYAPPHRSKWWRRVVVALLLIGIGWGVKAIIPTAIRQLKLLTAQTACKNFDGEHANKSVQDAVAGGFATQMRSQNMPCYNIAGAKGDFVFVGMLSNKTGERLVFVRRYGPDDTGIIWNRPHY